MHRLHWHGALDAVGLRCFWQLLDTCHVRSDAAKLHRILQRSCRQLGAHWQQLLQDIVSTASTAFAHSLTAQRCSSGTAAAAVSIARAARAIASTTTHTRPTFSFSAATFAGATGAV